MSYSSYFRRAEALGATDPAAAERVLREAETKASDSYPMDWILCARTWAVCLNNRDNAFRCLAESECCTHDTRGLLELAQAYWNLLGAARQASPGS